MPSLFSTVFVHFSPPVQLILPSTVTMPEFLSSLCRTFCQCSVKTFEFPALHFDNLYAVDLDFAANDSAISDGQVLAVVLSKDPQTEDPRTKDPQTRDPQRQRTHGQGTHRQGTHKDRAPTDKGPTKK
ncbi:hypothetical protein niasHT_018373 [Heterodera trifolii]|uniref:Uncharacterized protein n=1 Tax=Heterodera trifolii TaxID=157864 RepID=A0ABD2LDE2_9BILA